MCNCSYTQMIPDSDHLEQQKKYTQAFSSQYLRVFGNFVYIYQYWRDVPSLAQQILVLQVVGGEKGNSEKLPFYAYFVLILFLKHPSLATVGC